MNARQPRFALVDSLRALAALGVLAYHLAALSGLRAVPGAWELARSLNAGVALFFAISGFVLYRPFLAARLRSRPAPGVGSYAWRRVVRIVPAYWAALTVTALVARPGILSLPDAVRFYGFAQTYDARTALSGIPAAWSLCVEMTFYAFLPVYASAMRRLGPRDPGGVLRAEASGVLALAAVGVAARWWSAGLAPGAAQVLARSLPTMLDWFAGGMALAVASVALERRREPAHPLVAGDWPWWAGGLTALVACAAVLWLGGRPGPAASLAVHLLYAVAALGLLAPAVLGHREGGRVRRLLASPALAWLGLVSYGIYLWQVPAFAIVRDLTPLGAGTSPAWLVAGPVAAIGAGALSFYAVERPALRLRGLAVRLAGRPRRRVDPGRAARRPPGRHRAPAPEPAGAGLMARR